MTFLARCGSRTIPSYLILRAYSTASRKYDVLIVGGGTAGIGLANNWLKHDSAPLSASGNKMSFGIVEPSEKHYYQPLWTLVGGNTPGCSAKSSEADTASLVPAGADLLVDRVATIDPKKNVVRLTSGETVNYKLLVVATGLQVNFDQVKGLPEALEDPDSGVCTNYSFKYCQKTAKLVKNFKGGHAYFTFPTGPVKCAGAPQKIMYLAHSEWKNKGVSADVHFTTAIEKMFAVDKYRVSLEKLCAEKNIDRQHGYNLVEVRGEKREAVFDINPAFASNQKDGQVTVQYDFLHATPPMGAPNFLKQTGLTDSAGFVNVDKNTLQHVEYPNVFALGDSANLPTSKTMAAIAAQIPVVRFRAGGVLKNKETSEYKSNSHQFAKFIENEGPIYEGYTSCPLPVGDSKGIIAEFNYEGKPQETMPWDQSQPSKSNFWLKAYMLPSLYWTMFMMGKWEGPWGVRRLFNPLATGKISDTVVHK